MSPVTTAEASPESSQRPARRGDITVLIHPHDWRTDITLGVVTSVTRDGMVKAWDEPMFTGSGPRPLRLRPGGSDRVLIIPAGRIDVGRAMAAYREHVYPGGDMIMPFGSEDELRRFLAPFAVRDTAKGEA